MKTCLLIWQICSYCRICFIKILKRISKCIKKHILSQHKFLKIWWLSRYDGEEEATWGRPHKICCCNNYLTTSETCEITPGWHDAYFILAILKIIFERLWMSGRCGNLPITGFLWRAHLKHAHFPIQVDICQEKNVMSNEMDFEIGNVKLWDIFCKTSKFILWKQLTVVLSKEYQLGAHCTNNATFLEVFLTKFLGA